LLWPIDTKLSVWIAYIKRQLGIAAQVSVIKVTVTKKEIQFPLNNSSLLWPIDTKLGVWIAYIKRQLGIATQVSVIKVKVTVTKNRNSVSAQLLELALAY
jgi:small basic protein